MSRYKTLQVLPEQRPARQVVPRRVAHFHLETLTRGMSAKPPLSYREIASRMGTTTTDVRRLTRALREISRLTEAANRSAA